MCEVFVLFRWLMGFPVLQSPYDKYELCCISSEANQRNLPPPPALIKLAGEDHHEAVQRGQAAQRGEDFRRLRDSAYVP